MEQPTLPEAGVTIRPAAPEDVALVLAFIRELAEYERLSHEVVASEQDLDHWLFGDRPAAEVVIAQAGDVPVGFALYFQSFSTFRGRPGLYLEDLFVRPAHRGQGVGRSLLQHLAKLCRTRGYGRMEWSVLNWNEDAIRFYRTMGATTMDTWSVFRLTGEALERA